MPSSLLLSKAKRIGTSGECNLKGRRLVHRSDSSHRQDKIIPRAFHQTAAQLRLFQIAPAIQRSGFAINDSQHLRQLTHFGGPWLGTIRWSPDSNSIVFDARPKGHSAIYRMAVNQGKPNWLRINHSKLGVHLGRATADTSTSMPHVAEHQRFGDAT